jgi:hypothetical protein
LKNTERLTEDWSKAPDPRGQVRLFIQCCLELFPRAAR